MAGIVSLDETNIEHLFEFATAFDVTVLVGSISGGVLELKAPVNPRLFGEGFEIKRGDELTLDASASGRGLYSKRLGVQEKELDWYVNCIPDAYRESFRKQGLKPVRFEATLNCVAQAEDVGQHASGVGLVRSELFAYSDASQRSSLKNIFLGNDCDGSSLQKFASGQQKQYEQMFDAFGQQRHFGIFPVRTRLLDALPNEILNAKELLTLSNKIPAANWRGVQMGLHCSGLYEAQLKSLFAAYARHLGKRKERPNLINARLEICVPMTQTVAEIEAVRKMARIAAKETNVSSRQFGVGSMIEHMVAVANIDMIAPLVQSLNIGGNDLTEQILGIPRGDAKARNECRLKQGDPYAVLYPQVLSQVAAIAQKAREANPRIKVGFCGAQATDLDSLLALGQVGLDYVSVPPTDRNLIALQADFALRDFALRFDGKKKRNPQNSPS